MGLIVVTSALTPALSPGRGRIVPALLEITCDWIGRTVGLSTSDGHTLLPLLGERAGVRADISSRLQNGSSDFIQFGGKMLKLSTLMCVFVGAPSTRTTERVTVSATT